MAQGTPQNVHFVTGMCEAEIYFFPAEGWNFEALPQCDPFIMQVRVKLFFARVLKMNL